MALANLLLIKFGFYGSMFAWDNRKGDKAPLVAKLSLLPLLRLLEIASADQNECFQNLKVCE